MWRKIVFLFICWKYTTNEIYIQQRKGKKKEEKGRKRKHKEESLQIRKNPYKLGKIPIN